jgi:chlorite dismutase
MNDRLWTFSGGDLGTFRVARQFAVTGEALAHAARLDVRQGPSVEPCAFRLCGVTSNERYVTQNEKAALVARQAPIGRPEAVHGAMIPIKKSAEWWALPQDERRAILEERSRHILIGLEALPAVARRLHHCRDLATAEPFDFITWFDYRPEDTQRFDDLVGALRATLEWQYVEREVELRVER